MNIIDSLRKVIIKRMMLSTIKDLKPHLDKIAEADRLRRVKQE